VTNCTFSGNTATAYGGAVYSANGSAPTLTNCILWGDSATTDGDEIADDSSTTAVTYSDVDGSHAGTGNIDADPLFVSTADLHLQSTSPCIDAGSNAAVPSGVTTDLDGDPRIVDGPDADSIATVDMGAYEL